MPVPTNYISKGIWRGLIGALMSVERPVQSSYISGEI